MYRTWLLTLLAVVPTSTNFTLKAYDFGNGAGAGSSANYKLQASVGTSGGTLASSTYSLPAGIQASITIPVPQAPTFSNPDTSYSRLQLILNATGFASDTKYLIALSDDNFTTTKYVQADHTVGTAAGITNYQTYANWGGASGFWVLGLASNTIYKVKVAAWQGGATGSAFGATASATTSTPSVTFALNTSLTSTPPFAATFTSLTPGSVIAASATVTSTFSTNALNGGSLQLRGQNGGLTSTTTSYTLASANADLNAASKGYGAQVTAATQTSGGPVTATSPFTGTANSVGALTNALQEIASFSSPVTAGSVTVALKAKSDTSVPPAANYSDTLTLSFVPNF